MQTLQFVIAMVFLHCTMLCFAAICTSLRCCCPTLLHLRLVHWVLSAPVRFSTHYTVHVPWTRVSFWTSLVTRVALGILQIVNNSDAIINNRSKMARMLEIRVHDPW